MTRPVAPRPPPRVAEESDLVGCIPHDEQLALLRQWQQTTISPEEIRVRGFAALADALEHARGAGG